MYKLIIPLFALALFINGCGSSPRPIAYNEDSCENCKMLITDNKYGAELITEKGKVYKYDSIECLIGAAEKGKINDAVIASLWVTDFSRPGTLINAENAHYLKNDKFHSPMGLNILAVENSLEIESLYNEHGGEKLNWNQVKEYNFLSSKSKSGSHQCCPADEHDS